MTTTKDEQPKEVTEREEVISSKSVMRKDVLKAYNEGANYYDLAREFIGFESEEAVEKIRQIVEG